MKVLIKAGADVNHKDMWYRTPLMLAAEEGHTEVVRALIRGGAACNLTDEYDTTALTFAVDKVGGAHSLY